MSTLKINTDYLSVESESVSDSVIKSVFWGRNLRAHFSSSYFAVRKTRTLEGNHIINRRFYISHYWPSALAVKAEPTGKWADNLTFYVSSPKWCESYAEIFYIFMRELWKLGKLNNSRVTENLDLCSHYP